MIRISFLCAIFILEGSVFAKTNTPFIKGLLIETTKDTQVFAGPSSRSKIIADVPSQTSLLLLRRSTKGLWLYVEDEDGNRAWVANSHTNFVALRRMQTMPSPPPENPELLPQAINPQKTYASINRFSHEFSLTGRWSDSDPIDSPSYGLFYTLYFLSAMWSDQTQAQSGLVFGYFSRFGNLGSFIVPLRLRYLSQSSKSRWRMGPDIGLTFARDENKKRHYSLGLGYSVGYSLSKNLQFYLRPGVDLFQDNRWVMEGALSFLL